MNYSGPWDGWRRKENDVSCLILSCQCLVLDSHVYPYGGGRRQGRCAHGYTLTLYGDVSRYTWRSRCYCASGWRWRHQRRCDTWQCCPNQYDPYYPYDLYNPFFPNFPLNPIPTIRTPTTCPAGYTYTLLPAPGRTCIYHYGNYAACCITITVLTTNTNTM